MMHHEIFHPSCSWGNFNDVPDSTYYHDQDFLFANENSIEIFSNPISYNSELSDDYFPMISEVFDPNLSFEFDGLFEESSEGFWSPSSQLSSKSDYSSVDVTSKQQDILILPSEEETKNIIDNELRLSHLLMAYSEAMEKGHSELSRVILRRVNERSNPIGKNLERIAFELSKEFENESEYLMKESMTSFDSAFEAFYRIFPYGKFAHFIANSAILDATSDDDLEITTIHLVDFDLGEGLQWSQMIEEAVRMRFKRLKLTSIRWELEDEEKIPSFDGTRRKLVDHARSCGLDLKMEEIGIEDLVNHLKKSTKNGVREFLAFNCVVGIPHMRRLRNRSLVIEFVRLAKEILLANNNNNSFRGILVLADGDPGERLAQNCFTFGQFFKGHLGHYKAILESMESGFPSHLAEARVGMECLFVAPFVHSGTWLEKWVQLREGRGLVGPTIVGLEGLRLSGESVMEGNEMVRGETCYGVRVGGVNGNEIALEWNEIPLVKVSVWTSQS